jgi:hypothetical protein
MSSDLAGRPEHWCPIIGYEGLYEVSDFGRVRSLRSGKLLAAYEHQGYLAVTLHGANGQRTRHIQRLVLEAFAGPRPPGQQACHGPWGSLDNRYPENLRWDTPVQNSDDKARHAIMRGEIASDRVLPRKIPLPEDIWLRLGEVAQELGRSRSDVVLDALTLYLSRSDQN